MMVEMELLTQNSNQKKQTIRQPPSIPFLWEEKPGIPKQHWEPPSFTPSSSLPKTPTKLVASVPFLWEEKPGKPLPIFPNQLLDFPQPADDGCGDHDELDFETCSSATEYSMASTLFLLSDCPVPSLPISNVAEVEKTSSDDNSKHLKEPYSQDFDTGNSSNSWGAGSLSHAKSSFLESLFPLLPTNSKPLLKIGCHEHEQEANAVVFGPERTNMSVVERRTTLGELIRMSRMISCRRKTIQMRKTDHSTASEFLKNRAFGCFNFGIISSMNMIKELQTQEEEIAD